MDSDNDLQPEAADFVETAASCTEDGEYSVKIMLQSGEVVTVAAGISQEEATYRRISIIQAMIEFRASRNDWNDRH